MMSWSAVTGELSVSVWLLYVTCFFWTPGYDNIYAHQDKLDDARIGVKSATLAFGRNTKNHIILYYLFMVGLLAATRFFNEQSWAYYLGIAGAFIHLMWQILTVNLDNRADCMSKFRSNGMFGWIIFIGIIISGFVT